MKDIGCRVVIPAAAALLTGCATMRGAPESSGFADHVAASGAAKLDDRRYVVVNGTSDVGGKRGGPRIGVIDIDRAHLPRYSELAVNWGEFGGPSNDLEAVCAIPGRPREFLAAESGYVGDRFGRVFHFAVDDGGRAGLTARIIQVMALPHLYDRVEGMAIGRAANGELILVLGERGSGGQGAKISWGRLQVSLAAISFGIQGDVTFNAPWAGDASNVVDCSDLFIDARNRLWVAAASDPGSRGPFRSIIFRLGDFDAQRRRPMVSPDPLAPTWTIDGCRVEAIAAARDDDSSLCFVSNDGELGGIWRPLASP